MEQGLISFFFPWRSQLSQFCLLKDLLYSLSSTVIAPSNTMFPNMCGSPPSFTSQITYLPGLQEAKCLPYCFQTTSS